jgi:DNA-binding CsgD family transcriptional regulator
MKNEAQLIAYTDRLREVRFATCSNCSAVRCPECSAASTCCHSSIPSTAPMPASIRSITRRSTLGSARGTRSQHNLATGNGPEHTRNAIDVRQNALSHLREVFLAERHGLSPREAEICAHIVLGYSALAISLNLGISVNTVTTHRKRAYGKLRVCSQNELFERYFTSVVAG